MVVRRKGDDVELWLRPKADLLIIYTGPAAGGTERGDLLPNQLRLTLAAANPHLAPDAREE